MRKPYVVLDRDGTVIAEKHYLASPEDVELLPNAGVGLRRFQEMGYGLVVLTNQSGIGRGFFSETTVNAVHRRLSQLLAAEGVQVDGYYSCPHTPDDGCGCRKPQSGLFEKAEAELGLDRTSSIVIGDKRCDIDLGRGVGLTTVLVRTGYGQEQLASGVAPDFVAEDLLNASEIIANKIRGLTGPFLGAPIRLQKHFSESICTKQRAAVECERDILVAASAIADAMRRGGKVLLCGNGGSAADCQHIAAEFVSVLTQSYLRPGLAALALTTDSSILTASANDFGFEGIFARQVQALSRPGDVLIAISTSGNSENVLRAVACAREHEVHTIGLTGASGGKIAAAAHISIRVPSTVTMHIQEAHITIGHILCDLVERALFEESAGRATAAGTSPGNHQAVCGTGAWHSNSLEKK